MGSIIIDGKPIRITNPKKLLWPELGIRKIDYVAILMRLAPHLIKHAANRLLTAIRYPDGINGKSFYQKNVPASAPVWIDVNKYNDTNYMLLNSQATLAYLANQAVLEFHTAFNLYTNEAFPTDLVFDLDPSSGQSFTEVTEAALLIHETLDSLGIKGWVKTSGATGLQIYIPLGEKYTYETARQINYFFGRYLSTKHPNLITIERIVKKRGSRVYFDYLQMWSGKTIMLVYSPRATPQANVSTPVEWEELQSGVKPEDFNLLNIEERIKQKGDLFAPLLDNAYNQNLDTVLAYSAKFP